MRRPFPKVEFSVLPPQHAGVSTSRAQRLALLPYREVMDYLQASYKIPLSSRQRANSIELMGHKVSINGLKLRTFAHFDEQQQSCCANRECGVQPAYFALETPHANKRPHYSVAYLSLYGLDSNGNEIEFTHDHTLARCFGGANTLANTTMMCFPCNNRKSRIESRLHHRTLRVLKEFLEDSTGEAANPQFLLERVRNADFNFNEPERIFERDGVVDLHEVLASIRDPNRQAFTWFGRKVKTTGVRLEAFANDQACCQNPQCKLQASHFAVERVATDTFYANHGYHLNMYGTTPDGRELQFLHHHMLQPGHDGIPESFAIVTLCGTCKEKSLTHDDSQMVEMISSLGGVARDDFKSMQKNTGVSRWELEQNEISKKTQKIWNTASRLAQRNNLDMDAYIKLCNQNAVEEQINNALNAKHNAVRRVVNTLIGITPAGARWFRKEQRSVYGAEHGHNKAQLSSEEIANTHINIARVRKINSCAAALAQYHQMDVLQYLEHCQTVAHQQGQDNTLFEQMNALRQIVAVLEISPAAARVFNNQCGTILHMGPDRPDGVVQLGVNDLSQRLRSLRGGDTQKPLSL